MDLAYLLLLQSFRTATGGILNSFFLFVTTFGENYYPYFLIFAIYWLFNKDMGNRLLFAALGGTMLNGILKLTACVYRPWIRDASIVPAGDAKVAATGYSFPSGHTTTATATYGSMAVFERRHRGLCIGFVVTLLLVMFSRNYLGVHTPQDVLVGFSVTALFAWLMNKVIDWVEAEPTGNRDAVVLGISLAVIALALVYFTHKSYPMDYGTDGKLIVDPLKMMGDSFVGCGGYCGLVLGWFVERRWIRFSLDVDFYAKATRLLSGALMYVVFMKIPLPILQAGLGNLAGGFIGAILTSFYCVALHPMLFTWFENRAANQPASSATK